MPRISITEPGKDSQAYRFDMKRMKVTVGRSSQNDIKVSHRSTSKIHATIERLKGGLVITDNDSTNGISLDGERMNQITLTNGMEVHIGDVSAVFSLTDEECDQLTEERFRHRKNKEDDKEEHEDKEVNTLAETD